MKNQNVFERNTAKLLFERIPWIEGERAEYVICLAQDYRERVQMGDIIVENRLSNGMEDEYIVVSTRTRMYSPNYIEEVDVYSDKNNYRPLFTQAILHTPGEKTIKVKGEYKGKKVEISINSDNGTEKTRMNVPSDVFDNYQAHFLMRALIGKCEGYCTSIYAVHILKKLVVNPWLKVEGKDVVEVPGGTFVCWRISSKEKPCSEVRQYILFSEREPFPLIKSIQGSQIIELTKYVRP